MRPAASKLLAVSALSKLSGLEAATFRYCCRSHRWKRNVERRRGWLNLSDLLRLSEHPLSQQWLARLITSEDRVIAAGLLDRLKLVSGREFEVGIEQALKKLQKRLRSTIAVYRVSPTNPPGVVGYGPFTGGIASSPPTPGARLGKRRHFGSEDRVGHLIAKLEAGARRTTSSSAIECGPTLVHLKSQGIRHIVLVDDICGSGTRITNYWRKVVPPRIKSLLSLKKCEFWIVLYAITPMGRRAIRRAMPNLPKNHVLSVLREVRFERVIPAEQIALCKKYAAYAGRSAASLGYRGSASHVVFEHGCPNNAPAILWESNGLFPNRLIPAEIRPCFDEDGTVRAVEGLWSSGQRKLALSILDALEHVGRLKPDNRLMLTLLGFRLRGVSEGTVAAQLQIPTSTIEALLTCAQNLGLYELKSATVSQLGQEFVDRFRRLVNNKSLVKAVGKNPAEYYPAQCGGKARILGKAEANGTVAATSASMGKP